MIITDKTINKQDYIYLPVYRLFSFSSLLIIGFFIVLMIFKSDNVFGKDISFYISTVKANDDFTLSAQSKSAPLYISTQDFPGVIRALRDLQTDIKRRVSNTPNLTT